MDSAEEWSTKAPVKDGSSASVETALKQKQERLQVHPGALSRLFVRRPRLTCCVSVLVPVLAGAIVVLLRLLQLNDPTGEDYLIRNDERTLLNGARVAARVEFGENVEFMTLSALKAGAADARARAEEAQSKALEGGTPEEVEQAENAVAEAEAAEKAAEEALDDVNDADSDAEPRSDLIAVWGLSLLFRKPDEDGKVVNKAEDYESGANVLTREAIAEMKRLEDFLEKTEDYNRFCHFDEDAVDCNGEVRECAFVASITNHPMLYGIYDENSGKLCGRREGSEPVSAKAFDSFLEELVKENEDGDRRVQGPYAGLLGSEVTNGTTPQSFLAVSGFSFGRPVEGYESSDEQRAAQQAEYIAWVGPVADDIESSAADSGVLDVVALSEAYLNSVFGGQALVDLSFAGIAIALVMIFIWIHTGSLFLAATAMLQVLLAFPFAYFFYRVVAQVKYFSSLQIMTIFLILGIAADDVFVFTDAWKQAAVVLGPNVDLERRMSWTYKRAVKAMAVTSFTTAMAFFVTATSPIMPISTLGIWAAFLVLLQYVLVITIYPCATVIWQRSLRPRTCSNRFRKGEPPNYVTREDDLSNDEVVRTAEPAVEKQPQEVETVLPQKRPIWKRALGIGQVENEYRAVERFFRNRWIVWVNKARYAVIIVAIIVLATSLYLTTRLEPLSETERFLPENNRFIVALDLLSTALPVADSGFLVTATVVWGLQGLDRSGTSRYDPTAPGKAILDDTFDLKSAGAQQAILETCDTIEDRDDLVSQFSDDPVDCWIRDFKSWREQAKNTNEFETYTTDEALVEDLKLFASYVNTTDGSTPYLRYISQQRIGFAIEPERVVFSEVRFKTDVNGEEPYQIMWPIYTEWVDQVIALNSEAPESANKAYPVAGYPWIWQITQNRLVRNAFIGLGIMLAVAFVVLSLSTLNVIVAVFATLTIGGIVVNLLGFIYLFGWELGITESIGIIIATGVSFDFASHLSNAYVESKSETRYERVRDALTDLGISVLAGALSTILAGSMLFFAVIVFFNKFAVFVVLTVALSLIWSLTALIAGLLIAGPIGDKGSLALWFAKISGKLRKGSTAEADKAAPSAV